MQRTTFQQLVIVGLAGAVALLAADFWKSKDYTQWSSEEVNKMLTDSPWAKQMTVNAGQPGMRQRREGMGGGGSRGGIGFPGGGIGFPGGGYPGGGGRGGGGRYPDDQSRGGMRSMNVGAMGECVARAACADAGARARCGRAEGERRESS